MADVKKETELAKVTRELKEWRERAAKHTADREADARNGVGVHGMSWRGWPSLKGKR